MKPKRHRMCLLMEVRNGRPLPSNSKNAQFGGCALARFVPIVTPSGDARPRKRSDGCFTATAATVSPTPEAGRRKPPSGLRRVGTEMTTQRSKIAAFLSASALVVLGAACPLYVLGGGSGETRDARGRERHAAGAPGSGRRGERGRRSPLVLVPRRPH